MKVVFVVLVVIAVIVNIVAFVGDKVVKNKYNKAIEKNKGA